MSRTETVQKIEALIDNRYAETHVAYHAEHRLWHHSWQRGCYAQIADTHDSTLRIYADSYAELLEAVEVYVADLSGGSCCFSCLSSLCSYHISY